MFLGIDSGLDVQSHFHFTSFTLVLLSFPLNYSWFLTYSFTTPTIIIYLSPSLSESLTFSLTIQSHLHFVCFSLVTTSFPLYCSWFPTYSVTTTYKRTNLVLYLYIIVNAEFEIINNLFIFHQCCKSYKNSDILSTDNVTDAVKIEFVDNPEGPVL